MSFPSVPSDAVRRSVIHDSPSYDFVVGQLNDYVAGKIDLDRLRNMLTAALGTQNNDESIFPVDEVLSAFKACHEQIDAVSALALQRNRLARDAVGKDFQSQWQAIRISAGLPALEISSEIDAKEELVPRFTQTVSPAGITTRHLTETDQKRLLAASFARELVKLTHPKVPFTEQMQLAAAATQAAYPRANGGSTSGISPALSHRLQWLTRQGMETMKTILLAPLMPKETNISDSIKAAKAELHDTMTNALIEMLGGDVMDRACSRREQAEETAAVLTEIVHVQAQGMRREGRSAMR